MKVYYDKDADFNIIKDKVIRNKSVSKALFYSKKYSWSKSSNMLANYLIKIGLTI